MTYLLTLTPSGAEALALTVRGEGGFQSLLRRLQQADRNGNTIYIDGKLAERISRYAARYGEGGFQARLRRLGALRKIEAA